MLRVSLVSLLVSLVFLPLSWAMNRSHSQLDQLCSELWTPEVTSRARLPSCSPSDLDFTFKNGSVSTTEKDLIFGWSVDPDKLHPNLTSMVFTRFETPGTWEVPAEAVVAIRGNERPVLKLSPRFTHKPLASPPTGIPNVYVLILDSTSRISLSRFAPSLALHLESSEFTKFSLFTPVSPGGTRSTLFPLLYGGVPSDCPAARSPDYARMMDFAAIAKNCTAAERRLFELTSDRVTGFIEMTKSKQFLFSEKPVEHVLPNLPHEQLFRSVSAAPDNICVGSRLGVEEVLEYSEKIVRHGVDSGRGSFVVTHLSGAHETPAHLESLDEMVARHLEAVQQMLAADDSLLLVMGDHGLVDIHCDYRRPFLAIRGPERLKDNLDKWSHSRVSPWDLYATLKFALTGERTGFASDFGKLEAILAMPLSLYDKQIDFKLDMMHPVNLLQDETLSESRSCGAAGVSALMCDEPSQADDMLNPLEAYICGAQPGNLPQRLPLDLSRASRVHRMGQPGLFSWCQQYMKVAEQCVNFLNSLLPARESSCRKLELAYLESGVLDHTTGLWDLIVHMHTGGAIEGTFLFSVSDMDTQGILSMRMMGFKQLTRFRKHEQCTPRDINPEICLCSDE